MGWGGGGGGEEEEAEAEAEEVNFFFGAKNMKEQIRIRVILNTAIASAHTPADTYPHAHNIEETPPVWVFKSKQTLMSHLSVSLTSVLLLERSFHSYSI